MAGLNLLVFREGRRAVTSNRLRSALLRQLSKNRGRDEAALAALLRAGELECAVCDLGEYQPLPDATDLLAESLLNPGSSICDYNNLKISIEQAILPEKLTVSPPEGFAYYGLHPLAYSAVLQKLAPLPSRIVVIGIRTIGTTLSAVCSAAARKMGIHARRFTVRPDGHPYDRRTQFSPEQSELVRCEAAAHATFLVVDEGPGLSGSSFLSVGEALEQAQVPRERITFVCSHEPRVQALCAPDAPQRWRRFRSIVADSPARKPEEAQIWIGGGEWRHHLLPSEASFPGSWVSFERPKYLSSGASPNRRFFKFLGLGHYGENVFERESRVADAGFGPPPRMESDGYVSYPLIEGRPMAADDLSERALARMAGYCAFRLLNFSAEPYSTDALQKMAEHNLAQLRLEISVKLQVEKPVLVDGRMAPHEWLFTNGGEMLKTDSGSHGDDHFFPGITDIVWDLAGAIVEWKMKPDQAAAFLDMYRKASGDNALPRITEFIKAYTVFRAAYCMMAANAMRGTEEEARLEQAGAYYRNPLILNLVGSLKESMDMQCLCSSIL
ncbi:MAG TPA: hypothetical protein VG759_24095 [Candidatus Angelobacter sp.]|jgi:hypothetical protein|nr:hypothetical protein [Candidatus Angelobacter sp.]